MTFVRNRWYVAAWDSEVDRTPFARTICGEPLVFWRKLDRSVVALRDACPHRLLPLSMGIKEGDSIRCRYHGLKVGPDGVAEEMPVKSERVNTSVCATAYPVAERHRFIWVWIGDPALADPATIPDFWPCSTPGWTFDGGYYRIACDYRLVIDNLMDLTHETYVHAGSIGQLEINETPLETETHGDEVIVRRWMPNIEPPPFWRDALKSEGLVDRWQICHFLPPSSVLIDVGVAPVGAGATPEEHDQGVRGFVVDALTPESETTSHYFWGMARNFEIDDLGFTARFKAQQGGVFLEDVEILEAQQRSIEANPDMKLRAYSIDQGGVRARRIIERLARKLRLPNDLDDILGFHLRLAYGAVLRHFTEHFAELELTQKQVSVLWLAHDHPGIAQTDLAARLQMDRASTMAIVHALERRGLLARGHSAHDKRRVALSLTTLGETALTQARSAISTHEAWLTGRFSKTEIDQLTSLLRRIHD